MRLATWNILHGMSLDDGRVDAARLRAAVTGLGADVLAVQEADIGQPRSGGLDLMAEIAAGFGPSQARFLPALVAAPAGWHRATEADDPAGGAYGIGLLSRYPVRAWHALRLPVVLPAARWIGVHDEPRVALAAVVETPRGVMTIASTHLSVLRGWNALQLCRLSYGLRRLPAPQVILGDLNMPAREAGPASGFGVLARHRTHPSSDPRVQLDHALGRGPLPPVRTSYAPRLPVSDHRPLVVEM